MRSFRSCAGDFPGVEIMGSTLDAFARKLDPIKASLPVITQELGDTWIHGVGTDPAKISQFRALLRLRAEWLEHHRIDPQSSSFKAFSRFLLMVPEHTWGLDMKTHLKDFQAYGAAAFKAARGQADFLLLESSWKEQRAYLHAAVEALEDPFAREARQALEMTAAVRPDLSQFEAVSDPSTTFQTAFFRVRFSPLTGAIVYLNDRLAKRNWATPKHTLGSLHYETFSQADYDRFFRQYIIAKGEDISWAVQDFSKPGIALAGAQHTDWLPQLRQIYRRSTDQAEQFMLYPGIAGSGLPGIRLSPQLYPAGGIFQGRTIHWIRPAVVRQTGLPAARSDLVLFCALDGEHARVEAAQTRAGDRARERHPQWEQDAARGIAGCRGPGCQGKPGHGYARCPAGCPGPTVTPQFQ